MRYTDTPKWLFMLASISVGVAFSFLIAALIAGAINGALILIRHHHLAPRIKRYILALCCVYSLYAVYHGLEDPKSRKALYGARRAPAPLKIVQLSDVHIGGLMDEERVAKIVFLVNQTEPDLIAITGDLVDTSLANAESSLALLRGTSREIRRVLCLGQSRVYPRCARYARVFCHFLVSASCFFE